MKVLIWIATIFVGTLLNALIGAATGVRAGALLLYLAEFYVAKKLCEKWDASHLGKEEPDTGLRCGVCGAKLDGSSKFCRQCGTAVGDNQQ